MTSSKRPGANVDSNAARPPTSVGSQRNPPSASAASSSSASAGSSSRISTRSASHRLPVIKHATRPGSPSPHMRPPCRWITGARCMPTRCLEVLRAARGTREATEYRSRIPRRCRARRSPYHFVQAQRATSHAVACSLVSSPRFPQVCSPTRSSAGSPRTEEGATRIALRRAMSGPGRRSISTRRHHGRLSSGARTVRESAIRSSRFRHGVQTIAIVCR